MTEQVLAGLAASPGIAAGLAKVLHAPLDDGAPPVPEPERVEEAERALAALSAAASEILELAAELEERGNPEDAAIVETGALMAADPGLTAAVRAAVADHGAAATVAIVRATNAYAEALRAVDDPTLALRADDVRSLGRRAAGLVTGARAADSGSAGADAVLVASELGPADVAELGTRVRAVALSAGGATAHAAIVARSLGVPMVVAAGDELLRLVRAGTPLVVDGDAGLITIAPGSEARRRAQVAAAGRLQERRRTLADRGLAAETRDGRRIRVLANVATPAEVGVALGGGAEGVGLLRTELRFLEAADWPTEEEHRRALAATLAPLGGMVATVRMLDFGGDKTPPFLDGNARRGIGLLLTAPAAVEDQARAIASTGAHTELRVLLPLVECPEEVEIVREIFRSVSTEDVPAIGAMIETEEGVARLDEIAEISDFLSIGTNDLTHSILATDRFAPGEAVTHHPRVLAAIAAVAVAARERGLPLEVCGEAASEPTTMPLLLGLGIDELSVGAARVGTVRRWVRCLDFDGVRTLAEAALTLASAQDVAELMAPVAELLGEAGDAAVQGVERGGRVVTVGRQA